MSGRTMAPRYSISPKWFMPVSITAASCSGARPSSVRGVPMSLLKFSGVLRTFSLAPSTAAIISLVVVLPTLPVICTKGISNRSR